ncbi:DUF429 domain-containing protein [Thermodesulfatator atlanticus]|uniref:DUF429 domain-containing protein n=1 Tax=Thermodesulfatator atlanticus TaxID=501497 RepID=UPI0003B6F492|nr:DUF429 domain-containing protein [Thermodesulfatator atlanticus]
MKKFNESYGILAGVDGCSKGWCVALGFLRKATGAFTAEKILFCRDITEVFNLGAEVYAIDMPIGLPMEHKPGGRKCDRLARKLLGPRRASIFTPPPRKAFSFKSYEALSQSGIRISRQSFNILPKIKELDLYLRKCRPKSIYETHPELVFFRLHGDFLPSKHTSSGLNLRVALLVGTYLFRSLERNLNAIKGNLRLDVLDAYACLLAAKRIYEDKAQRVPENIEKDAFGLEMAIWF